MGIQQAINFGKTKIGLWHYCTNNNLRFGQTNTCADCSGFVSRCLWEGGMPRYAMPENSADIARYFQFNHPERRLSIDEAKHTFGAVLVKGGIYGYGPRGHVVFSLGNGTQTLESSGSGRGVGILSINRLTWSHAGLPPISFAAPTPPKPPAPPIPIVEDNMQVIIYRGTPHTFWIDQDGWLQHSWGPGASENMNQTKYGAPGEKYDANFAVSAAVNGDWLNVRVVCNTIPPPRTEGRRLMCFDSHPSYSPTWRAYTVTPK